MMLFMPSTWIPYGIPLDHAFDGCANCFIRGTVPNAWEGLVNRARTQAGQKILVQGGASGVGHIAVRLARALGAELFAMVRPDKAEIVRGYGVTPIDHPTVPVDASVATHRQRSWLGDRSAGSLVVPRRHPLGRVHAAAAAHRARVRKPWPHPARGGRTRRCRQAGAMARIALLRLRVGHGGARRGRERPSARKGWHRRRGRPGREDIMSAAYCCPEPSARSGRSLGRRRVVARPRAGRNGILATTPAFQSLAMPVCVRPCVF